MCYGNGGRHGQNRPPGGFFQQRRLTRWFRQQWYRQLRAERAFDLHIHANLHYQHEIPPKVTVQYGYLSCSAPASSSPLHHFSQQRIGRERSAPFGVIIATSASSSRARRSQLSATPDSLILMGLRRCHHHFRVVIPAALSMPLTRWQHATLRFHQRWKGQH